MKAEVKFCATKNGPKAFVNTYDDNWELSNEPLLAYKKDMRSIRSASPYEEGKDYRVVMSPWVLDDFFQANKIDDTSSSAVQALQTRLSAMCGMQTKTNLFGMSFLQLLPRAAVPTSPTPKPLFRNGSTMIAPTCIDTTRTRKTCLLVAGALRFRFSTAFLSKTAIASCSLTRI